jgi:hypothetical protein
MRYIPSDMVLEGCFLYLFGVPLHLVKKETQQNRVSFICNELNNIFSCRGE